MPRKSQQIRPAKKIQEVRKNSNSSSIPGAARNKILSMEKALLEMGLPSNTPRHSVQQAISVLACGGVKPNDDWDSLMSVDAHCLSSKEIINIFIWICSTINYCFSNSVSYAIDC